MPLCLLADFPFGPLAGSGTPHKGDMEEQCRVLRSGQEPGEGMRQMKTDRRRISVLALLAAFVLSAAASLAGLDPASASVKGRRNTAIAVTGAAAYELARGHTGTGLVLGAGAAYAWKRTKDEKKAQARHRRYVARHHRSSRRHARSHRRHLG